MAYSPSEIFLWFNPSGPLKIKYKVERTLSLDEVIKSDLGKLLPEDNEHADNMISFIANRINQQKIALGRSEWYKDRAAQRHDLGIRGQNEYNSGELVMLYEHRQAGTKLRSTWRGPFVIVGFGGEMRRSYKLRQINGTAIPRNYDGDSLKKFGLRVGYLVTGEEESLPVFQIIRLGNCYNCKLIVGVMATL